jgi:tRNA(Arg) A34 adenosine deaminase TadA
MIDDAYPAWVLDIVKPGDVVDIIRPADGGPADGGPVADDAALMRLAIRVTLESLERTGGGPFGAIVATEEGRVVSVGYNLVVPTNDSTAHAEVVAIRRAERALGTCRLRGEGLPRLRLLTTCAPCIMCTGAIHWSGLRLVIAATRAEDAEAIGFFEGTLKLEPPEFFRERGIEYRPDFLRDEAVELFRRYRGSIYNG